MASALSTELAVAAARLIVEEGMEYGPAKRRAARDAGKRGLGRADLPSNEAVEDEVRAQLALFHADTHPAELRALRELAAQWMERLAGFRPHLTGAAWRGTATRLSSLHLDLYCDDPKSAEIALINLGVRYDVASQTAGHGREETTVLCVSERCPPLGEVVSVFLRVRDHDDLRGALKPDGRGRTQLGDLSALRRLIEATSAP